MVGTIELLGKEYPYTVKYKNIRSLIIKVEKGELVVSSSPYFTKPEIEAFMIKNERKLVKQLESYEPYLSVEQGYVTLYGVRYPLIINDLHKLKCELYNGKFYIYTKNVQSAFEAYAKDQIYHYTVNKIREYLSLYFDHQMPEVVVKKYKGRWGSCYYEKNLITFNLSLIYIEKELIDYVVMHELCHFLEANHSSRFYYELGLRMPDYKRRVKLLKGKHV